MLYEYYARKGLAMMIRDLTDPWISSFPFENHYPNSFALLQTSLDVSMKVYLRGEHQK